MAKKASDKPSASAEETLKRQKKQARREAKLMLEIEEANRDLKKAQKKQAKVQVLLEAERAHVQTLEARLAELRAPTSEPAIETPPLGIELEHQQEPSETGTSTFTDTEPTPSIVEEVTVSEVMVVTNEVTEGAAGQDDEIVTATEPAQTTTTPRKAPAHKTATTRKSTATKRPTSPSTANKRSASRSQSTRQPHSDAE